MEEPTLTVDELSEVFDPPRPSHQPAGVYSRDGERLSFPSVLGTNRAGISPSLQRAVVMADNAMFQGDGAVLDVLFPAIERLRGTSVWTFDTLPRLDVYKHLLQIIAANGEVVLLNKTYLQFCGIVTLYHTRANCQIRFSDHPANADPVLFLAQRNGGSNSILLTPVTDVFMACAGVRDVRSIKLTKLQESSTRSGVIQYFTGSHRMFGHVFVLPASKPWQRIDNIITSRN